MNNLPDKSEERRAFLESRIEEIKKENREVWGNTETEYTVAEYPGGLYIEVVHEPVE